MRTTMTTIHQITLANLNRVTSAMERVNTQISSGKAYSKISENPNDLVTALGLRSSLSEIKQYKDNLVYGDNLIATSENALTEIKGLLTRAKTLNIQAINGSLSSNNKVSMASEVKNLFEEAIILANSQLNGKYIFAGYRTTGYNDVEPVPFMPDTVDGYRIFGSNLPAITNELTGTVTNTAIAAGAFTVNGNAVGAINAGAVTNGLNMVKAANAKTAINAADPSVTATLTTLYAGGAATADAGAGSTIAFDLNNIPFNVTIPAGTPAAGVAALLADAVNAVTDQTGVEAKAGNGANGGIVNSLVLNNSRAGDEGVITIANLQEPGTAASGLVNGFYSISTTPNSNTGTISLASNTSFMLDTPAGNDSILQELGLAGGAKGFGDEADDGQLIYGYRLADGDLLINGQAVTGITADGISDSYADTSAAAKAGAINALSDSTSVRAVIEPVSTTASLGVEAGTIDTGDLLINGVDIFATPTDIKVNDNNNILLGAINAKTADTGIKASRDADGKLILTAIDGRNLHIETSANGERLTHLNGGSPVKSQSLVYFGTVKLLSDRIFSLESTPSTNYESGLASLGMAGGESVTDEEDDIAGDGAIEVKSIHLQTDNVRYTGERTSELSIKVGNRSTMAISQNGMETMINTGVLTSLKTLENLLNGNKFTETIGSATVTDTTQPIGTSESGLARYNELTSGNFTVTVTDNEAYPPKPMPFDIQYDPEIDTADSIAQKINGLPGLTATWEAGGKLTVTSIDPDRYSFTLDQDTGNLLDIAGVSQQYNQEYGLSQTLTAFDEAMDAITTHISDYGARANRIQVQTTIYTNLELTNSEYLSEKEDTDFMKALMELKAKEVTYQAALAAAAKTMQLSLVNFL